MSESIGGSWCVTTTQHNAFVSKRGTRLVFMKIIFRELRYSQ